MPPQNVAEKSPTHGRHRPAPMVPPAVPLTLDGSSVLHQMFRIRWPEWKKLAAEQRQKIVEEASTTLTAMEAPPEGGTGLFAQLGHKGDLLVVHFRRIVRCAARSRDAGWRASIWPPTSSPRIPTFPSSSWAFTNPRVQLYESLLEKGIEPGSPEWIQAEQEKIEESCKAMAPRLWPEIPPHRYLCFYPMDKKRGEVNNWYDVPIRERRRMMRDHGMIGRRYAGKVKQIISGSIGFDDWEWGVDLFADDPLVVQAVDL